MAGSRRSLPDSELMSARRPKLDQLNRSSVDPSWKKEVWQQFGAAIDMLDNAIAACPEAVWSDRNAKPEFWYLAFHTAFFLDLYLSDSTAGFTPPSPFTLDELDKRGVMPQRVYTRDEIREYVRHGRAKGEAR